MSHLISDKHYDHHDALGRTLTTNQPGLFVAAWRYRLLVLGITALFVLAALAFSAFRPQEPQYVASATVVIQEPITAESVQQQSLSGNYMRSQLEILRSPVVAEAAREIVIEEEQAELKPDDALPQTIIIGSTESALVSAEVTAPTPELATAYANAIAEAYREISQRQATSTARAQLALIDAQVDGIDERLREIEQEVADLVSGDSDLSTLKTQAEAAVSEIGRLQSLLVGDEELSEEEAEVIRQQIQDHREVMAVYEEVLSATASNPERRALEEEEARQVARRASLLTLRDQVAVDEGLAPDAVALVQPARDATPLPGVDVARVLGAAIVIGLGAGLAAAYFLSASRRPFASREEPAQMLGTTLLADVPDFDQEGLASPVPARDHPRSAAAEAFRFASSTLNVAARARSANSVFMASSTHGRGKTTVLVNTAIAAAVDNRSVLVLDCDFGHQEATRLLLGDDPGTLLGITDVIEGEIEAENATHEVELASGALLSVMPRGTRPSLAATTLQSRAARELVALLAGVYDLVLIDGPPMLQVAYASALAGIADGVVVVVENGSPQSELTELKSRLDLVGTPVLGYIFNRSHLRREMTVSEGSMKDILGTGGLVEKMPTPGRQQGP